MAYNKRTWLGRQGTGLNKFSIGGASPVTIVNQPDSVTQVGDALSAGNLNDLEDRIEDAFDETASQTEVTNLNNAINQLDHRVQNLEQSKGDYVVNTYKDGSITPSGKGAWAIVEGLRGVSRVENQQIDPNAHTNASSVGIIRNNLDGTFTITGSSPYTDYLIFDTTDPIIGHTYLFAYKLSKSVTIGTEGFLCGFNSGGYARYDSPNGVVFTENTTEHFALRVAGGYDASGLVITPILVDLNVYFGTSDLSFLGATDSAKLATIQTNYPHLLTPSEYGTRIVDSSYSGVRAWARNLWDEEWERGSYNLSTGEATDYVNNFRNKNIIDVKPNTTYYFMVPYNSFVCNYDADGNYLGYTSISYPYTVFTTGANVRKINFTAGASGASYANNICLNVSDSQNGTYTPYHAPQTLSLTFTGKSAGSVSEMYYPETGEQTHPIGDINIGNKTWTYTSGIFECSITTGISSRGADITCSLYVNSGEMGSASMPDKTIQVLVDRIWIKDTTYNSVGSASDPSTFLGHIQNTHIYIPLATPDPSTFVTPIIDNTLLTEAGGRMSTVQTGTVVDGSFDMGFITL